MSIAINARTGARIVATQERLLATADLSPDEFSRDAKGRIEFEHAGETDISWDSQVTISNARGPLFVDDRGAEVDARDVMLADECDNCRGEGTLGRRQRQCPDCKGYGYTEAEPVPAHLCPDCRAELRDLTSDHTDGADRGRPSYCDTCDRETRAADMEAAQR